MGFEGKVVLITGAAQGIGRQHALTFGARGARVVVQDINPVGAAEMAALVEAAGGVATAFACDVADVDEIAREIAAAGRIDVLINNAGVHKKQAIEEITEADFDWMFGTHVKGTFFTTQAVVPGMKARKAGKIVITSSAWGMCGWHTDSHYCGAKAALLGLTKAWARELAPWGISVNAVAPGVIMTEQTRLNRTPAEIRKLAEEDILIGRLGEPEDIAEAAAFLASAEAGFITGQVISPNGGEFIVGI